MTSDTGYVDASTLQNQSGSNWIRIEVKTQLIKTDFFGPFPPGRKNNKQPTLHFSLAGI